MSSPSTAFSAEIRAFLARYRKTATDLALEVGVSEATIYRRLNEDSPWPLDEAIKAARWAGISIESLIPSDSQGLSA